MLWSSWPPELLEKEKQQTQQSRVLTEKGLEREIKQKTKTKTKKSNLKMEMINFSGQYGENGRQWKRKRAGTQETKFFVRTWDIPSKKRVTRKFHAVVVKTTTKKCKKEVCCTCKVVVVFVVVANETWFFLFACLFCRSRCLRRLALHDCIFMWVDYQV